MNWRLWQLADSGFPTGGFAHSGGLEAAFQQGEISSASELRIFLTSVLWQSGYGGLPLLNPAFREPERLSELDHRAHIFLSNHVANRASRVQGRTFFATCFRSFPCRAMTGLEKQMSEAKIHRHLAPVFGATIQALGMDLSEAQRLYLFLTLRSGLSAAVRLGIIGPYKSQQMQDELATELNQVFEHARLFTEEDLAQPSPFIDLFQTNHDRLYSRLFQS